ncbi:MAG: MFS transporter [Oscillospiraceae bacterium]|nr:MFS transporter [Oscillospiraceae bacterium]MBR0452121.1 MFS transporter [Oscillospiraceae bacterium]
MAKERNRIFKISNEKAIMIATVFCFMIMAGRGMDTSVYNTLQPFIIDYFGTSLTKSSLFTTAESIGHLLINVVIMRLADRFDKVNALGMLVLLLGAVMLGIGSAPTMTVFVFLKFMQGMISPFMDNVCTAYTSDLHAEKRGTSVGSLFMLFSLAAALMPSYNTLVVDTMGMEWYMSYRGIGYYLIVVGILFLISFLFLFTRPKTLYTDRYRQKDKAKLSIKEMLRNRNMQALFASNITMSFYNFFSQILPTYFYMTNADVYNTAMRGFIATAGSIGRLASRILYVPFSRKIDTAWYLRFQAIMCTILSAVSFFVDNPYVWIVTMFLSGLLSGSSFTARTVLTCEEYPDYASAACAATGLAQGIASLVATPVMSYIADTVSFTAAMLIPIGFGFATYFVFRFMYRPHHIVVSE